MAASVGTGGDWFANARCLIWNEPGVLLLRHESCCCRSMNIAKQIESLDWQSLAGQLNSEGFALIPSLLTRKDCQSIAKRYDDCATEFRSTVDMARYNFGAGQYKYFAYPLPAEVQALRGAFYPKLAPIANCWAQTLGQTPEWPDTIEALTDRCRAAGQSRPTPLMLRYSEGDYNCLHQDLYGPIHFPLQVVILLSAPAKDFLGGELVLVEQRPRMQSRPIIVPIEQGGAAIIPVRERPRQGRVRVHRAQMRHGVGRIHQGTRTTLGLIFHDAS